ncbi:aromatic acid exporter family protein [Peribacillus alkalitolerans]|uniref:aromatic acid exporter family protein n=1 Tax=Peribacillus alkalitolerans TaxID=1550385 RepID=UPI0013D1B380|nr:aromatic acid exporter family protein [Peribacillus alkalitolerans]
MFKIGYRTLKTSIGVAIAILIAQLFGLSNFPSAGIITILSIQVTKKKSVRTSIDRFIACLISIVFSVIFFEGIGYHPIVIGLMLLFFIPTAVAAKVQDGIVTSSVIILHIYNQAEISYQFILNEISLILIGIGVGLIMNLYMPSLENTLYEYQEGIERKFSIILKQMAHYLRTNNTDWDGKEIVEVSKLLQNAKTLAFRDVENHFLRHENLFYHYFKMREKQFEIIERLLPLISSIPATCCQSHIVAEFIEEISENVHPENTANIYLHKLDEMMDQFKEMDLPNTREEFEVRAALIQITKEIQDYLSLKSAFTGLPSRQVNEKRKGRLN